MPFLKRNVLILMVFCFMLGLITIVMLDKYEKQKAPKIVLKAEKSPFDVIKPTPQNSNLTFDEIIISLRNSSLLEDKSLDIDDIE